MYTYHTHTHRKQQTHTCTHAFMCAHKHTKNKSFLNISSAVLGPYSPKEFSKLKRSEHLCFLHKLQEVAVMSLGPGEAYSCLSYTTLAWSKCLAIVSHCQHVDAILRKGSTQDGKTPRLLRAPMSFFQPPRLHPYVSWLLVLHTESRNCVSLH